jgi:general stress protein 26
MVNSLHEALFENLRDTSNLMIGLNQNAEHSEPMHICLQDNTYDAFWIFTRKNNRIAGGGKSTANFVSKDHKMFASFIGHLYEETDKATIQVHFSSAISAWYKDGILDENLKVLRFEIENVEIWEKDPSTAAKLKMAIGAKVDQDELGRHAFV